LPVKLKSLELNRLQCPTPIVCPPGVPYTGHIY
jgi:hypothetical protein